VMFHLDYLSCFLTVLATILLARKSWIGLLVAIANSLIVSVIGLRTSQLGFIPANLFCMGVYAFSMRSWLKERTHANRDQAQRQKSPVVPSHNGVCSKGAAIVTPQIINPEVNICNQGRASGGTPCVLN
jgi:hypothetical protein